MNKEAQVALTPISNILIGNRFRENLGDIDGLVQSIHDHGLIQPLAVCYNDESDDREYKLLAGGRRFTACESVDKDLIIPVRIYPSTLTELELRSIELEENIRRKDLDWQEEVSLCKEIHELQIKIHGTKVSTLPDAPGHSMRDTAKLTNSSPTDTSRKLKLASAMEAFPEMPWDKCKTQSDADKLLKQVGRHIVREDLVAAAKESYNGDDRKVTLSKSYIVKDFFSALDDLPDNTFNLVEVDPPYAIDLMNKKKDYGYEGYNEVLNTEYLDFMRRTLNGCFKKMSTNSWLILWFAPEPWFQDMYDLLIETGFITHRMVGIWNKKSGQTMQPSKRLGNAYEMFFYASKGSPELAKPGASNVFEYTVGGEKKFHPTQRPVEMIQDVLTTFTQPNSKILIPFAGSGATLVAAALANMHPIGYDLTSQYKQEYEIWLNEVL